MSAESKKKKKGFSDFVTGMVSIDFIQLNSELCGVEAV